MNQRILTIILDDDTLERLTAVADADGLSAEVHAGRIIEQALTPSGMREDALVFQSAHDWTEADRRLADYDRTGEFIDAAEALDAFVSSVDASAAARR